VDAEEDDVPGDEAENVAPEEEDNVPDEDVTYEPASENEEDPDTDATSDDEPQVTASSPYKEGSTMHMVHTASGGDEGAYDDQLAAFAAGGKKVSMLISGTIQHQVGDETIELSTDIKVLPAALIVEAKQASAMWSQPFGITDAVAVGLKGEFPWETKAFPRVVLEGNLGLGKDCESVMGGVAGGQCIYGATSISLGTDSHEPYLTAKIKALTMVDLAYWMSLELDDMEAMAQVLGATAFPEGVSLTYAKIGASAEGLDLMVPDGISLEGKMHVLGYPAASRGTVDAELGLCNIEAELPAIHLGGVMAMEKDPDAKEPRALINIDKATKSMKVGIQGTLNVLGFEAKGARIEASAKGFVSVVEGNLFGGAFPARVKLTAPFGSPSKVKFSYQAHLRRGSLTGLVGKLAQKVKDTVLGGLRRLHDAFTPLQEIAQKLGLGEQAMMKVRSNEVQLYSSHADLDSELGEAAFWNCLKSNCRGHKRRVARKKQEHVSRHSTRKLLHSAKHGAKQESEARRLKGELVGVWNQLFRAYTQMSEQAKGFAALALEVAHSPNDLIRLCGGQLDGEISTEDAVTAAEVKLSMILRGVEMAEDVKMDFGSVDNTVQHVFVTVFKELRRMVNNGQAKGEASECSASIPQKTMPEVEVIYMQDGGAPKPLPTPKQVKDAQEPMPGEGEKLHWRGNDELVKEETKEAVQKQKVQRSHHKKVTVKEAHHKQTLAKQKVAALEKKELHVKKLAAEAAKGEQQKRA